MPGVSAIGANATERFPATIARGMRQLCVLGSRKVLSEGANDCRGGLERLKLQKERVREEVASGNKSLLLNNCYSFT